ncbi:hypothetical protein BH10ACT1_BH10ACT1_33410 [soil metagenome]
MNGAMVVLATPSRFTGLWNWLIMLMIVAVPVTIGVLVGRRSAE